MSLVSHVLLLADREWQPTEVEAAIALARADAQGGKQTPY